MDILKGMLKAILVVCGVVIVPILLVFIGIALLIIGPVVGGSCIIGLPFIALGVIIGVRQVKKKN